MALTEQNNYKRHIYRIFAVGLHVGHPAPFATIDYQIVPAIVCIRVSHPGNYVVYLLLFRRFQKRHKYHKCTLAFSDCPHNGTGTNTMITTKGYITSKEPSAIAPTSLANFRLAAERGSITLGREGVPYNGRQLRSKCQSCGAGSGTST